MENVKIEVDATGLNCPLPILRAKKAINLIQAGELMKLIATDPGSVKDIDAFCQQTGHRMLTSQQNGSTFEFILQKQGR